FKIPGDYRAVTPFAEGLAWAERRNRTSAFIDKFGAPVFERPASSLSLSDVDPEQHTFRDGICLVWDGKGKFGYIDPKGNYIIPPQFEEAAPFRGPLAKVAFPTGQAYIDKSGKRVFPEK
ncbi:MAG: WG repeat-containing protein, partial [Blastocatellia bacterium]|nr:WG repeat-containing protein [Blastocatellia bacterium]